MVTYTVVYGNEKATVNSLVDAREKAMHMMVTKNLKMQEARIFVGPVRPTSHPKYVIQISGWFSKPKDMLKEGGQFAIYEYNASGHSTSLGQLNLDGTFNRWSLKTQKIRRSVMNERK